MNAPSEDLTTLAAVKAWIGITVATDDALLASLITAVSGYIENWLNRSIALQLYVDTYNGLGAAVQVLDNYPVASVSSVYVNGVLIPPRPVLGTVATSSTLPGGWVNDDFAVYVIGGRFWRGFQNVQISYQAGYATVPNDIGQACNDIVGDWYKYIQRIGKTSQAIESQTTQFVNQPMPVRAANILQQYKRVHPS